MTYEDWLACNDPSVMIDSLGKRCHLVFDRKVWLLIANIERIWSKCCSGWELMYNPSNYDPREKDSDILEQMADYPSTFDLAKVSFSYSEREEQNALRHALSIHNSPENQPLYCDLIREMFLPPIPPPEYNFDPAVPLPSILKYDNGIVPRIAQTIYDERRFEDMPILADAYMEAGGTNKHIINHLQGWVPCTCDDGFIGENDKKPTGKNCKVKRCYKCNDPFRICMLGWVKRRIDHCRGCWVLDFLLGKQ